VPAQKIGQAPGAVHLSVRLRNHMLISIYSKPLMQVPARFAPCVDRLSLYYLIRYSLGAYDDFSIIILTVHWTH